jgi:hypothetical protein
VGRYRTHMAEAPAGRRSDDRREPSGSGSVSHPWTAKYSRVEAAADMAPLTHTFTMRHGLARMVLLLWHLEAALK